MSAPACPHCEHPLGTSRIECTGCKVSYHVECMAEIKSCTSPGCEASLNEVLRQRSLAISGGAEGFTLGQRTLLLIGVLGGLFASLAVVETITPMHGVGVIVISIGVFTLLNPELLAYVLGGKPDSE